MKYTTERYTADISVEEYIEKYVAVEEFLEYCKACSNYEKKWSCPSYDFDVLEYWKKYDTAHFIAEKIIFAEEYVGKDISADEVVEEVIEKETYKLETTDNRTLEVDPEFVNTK